jgi:hypothetical protein
MLSVATTKVPAALSIFQMNNGPFNIYVAVEKKCSLHYSAHCRGVGFVNFSEPEAATRAKDMLQGVRVSEGRHLHIALQARLWLG